MSNAQTQLAADDSIIFGRADGRCECLGDCGQSHQYGIHHRCANLHGMPMPGDSVVTVSLQVWHLDDSNVIAVCQTCRKRLTGKAIHKSVTAQRREKKVEAEFVAPLFDLPEISEPTPGAHL
jgi:hypothetical protein